MTVGKWDCDLDVSVTIVTAALWKRYRLIEFCDACWRGRLASMSSACVALTKFYFAFEIIFLYSVTFLIFLYLCVHDQLHVEVSLYRTFLQDFYQNRYICFRPM
jgi:hypothetical protein